MMWFFSWNAKNSKQFLNKCEKKIEKLYLILFIWLCFENTPENGSWYWQFRLRQVHCSIDSNVVTGCKAQMHIKVNSQRKIALGNYYFLDFNKHHSFGTTFTGCVLDFRRKWNIFLTNTSSISTQMQAHKLHLALQFGAHCSSRFLANKSDRINVSDEFDQHTGAQMFNWVTYKQVTCCKYVYVKFWKEKICSNVQSSSCF